MKTDTSPQTEQQFLGNNSPATSPETSNGSSALPMLVEAERIATQGLESLQDNRVDAAIVYLTAASQLAGSYLSAKHVEEWIDSVDAAHAAAEQAAEGMVPAAKFTEETFNGQV